MRQDMYKVMHETVRGKSSVKGATRQVGQRISDLDEVDLPTRESMTKRYSVQFKGKRPQLKMSPLNRFIESRVGQPWNKVYAEVAHCFNKHDSVLYDIDQYIDVAKNTFMRDGEILVNTPFGVRTVDNCYYEYYVHPVTQTLEKVPQMTKAQLRELYGSRMNRKLPQLVVNEGKTHLVKQDGIWYHVVLVPADIDEKVTTWEPRRSEYSRRRYFDYGDSAVFVKVKRQLNHKELKAYGLLDA